MVNRLLIGREILQPVDIHFVLTVMGLLKLDKYPDRKTHPYGLFGQPRKVLTEFGDDVKRENSAFRKFLPRLHEILVITDRIQQVGVKELGRLKV